MTSAVIAAALVLCGGTALAANPPPGGDDSFNACLDYSTTAGNGGTYVAYTTTSGTLTVLNFKYTLVEPSCKNATYTFTVLSGSSFSTATPLWQDVRQGDGTTQTFFENASFNGGPSNICVFGQTSVNNKLYDWAPGVNSCLPMSTTGGSGANGWS